MAHTLKLSVVAEGVETEKELAFLSARDCDEGQGYYFSRPLIPEAFARLLDRRIDPPPPAALQCMALSA
jgi:EAL domain-containing protein (putative c-di-GMP-specific phosphodiesterase class I)